MPELVIRPRARADLKHIWKYSFEKWGAAQADIYLAALDREILTLLTFPQAGIACEEIRADYRCLNTQHYRVFYIQKTQRIEIIRVLHESIDVWSHLQ